jgi:glycerophosphoryl diester phosphodiesterase
VSAPRPLIVAHRGASGYEVENSLAAFRAAGLRGADAVELDVHAAADGGLVVHHDEALDATHHIPQMSSKRVREHRLSNGEPVPTLVEALDAVGQTLAVFIEVKSLTPVHDDRLLDALDHGPNPTGYAVHSFDHRIVRRLGDKRPALPRGVLSTSYPIRPLVALADAQATVLWQEGTLVDAALVETIHTARGRLFVWTVDREDDMHRFLDMGVDAIVTNFPDRGRRAVHGRRP